MADIHLNHTLRKQGGIVTLAIGMILLLLITLVTLYGARVTILEQRTSANEYRAKEAFAAAEAGLNIGIEHLKSEMPYLRSSGANGWYQAGSELWTQVNCNGASPPTACADIAESGLSGTVFFYGGIGDRDVPAPAAEVPLNNKALENGASYEIEYVLCPFDSAVGTSFPPADPCTSDIIGANRYGVLVMSRGVSADGTAEATVRQIVATYEILPGNSPTPLMASGTIDGSGTFDVVVNPNGGGPGIPMSTWTNTDVFLSGTATFCQVDEYFSTGSETTYPESPSTDFQVCSSCSCPKSSTLTYKDGSSGYQEGIDVVDHDGNVGPTPDETNFPDDVFGYTFGIPKADYTQVRDRAVGGPQPDCSGLDSNSRGLHWVTGACSVSRTIGHPEHPVLLVTESSITIQSGAKFFGMVFAFSDPANGIAGGDVQLRGGTQFYGAIISDHDIDIGNGSFQMIYSEDVLTKLRFDDSLKALGRVPGSWADQIDS